MTDKELLELAAKAAEFEITPHPNNKLLKDLIFIVKGKNWNPLIDDADSLRLAVKLRLTVSWDRYDDADYATATPLHTHQGYDCMVNQDPYAATRRAIVRAAAEIGKETP